MLHIFGSKLFVLLLSCPFSVGYRKSYSYVIAVETDPSAVKTIIFTTTAEGQLKKKAIDGLPQEQYPGEAQLGGGTVKRLEPNVQKSKDMPVVVKLLFIQHVS